MDSIFCRYSDRGLIYTHLNLPHLVYEVYQSMTKTMGSVKMPFHKFQLKKFVDKMYFKRKAYMTAKVIEKLDYIRFKFLDASVLKTNMNI